MFCHEESATEKFVCSETEIVPVQSKFAMSLMSIVWALPYVTFFKTFLKVYVEHFGKTFKDSSPYLNKKI